MNDLIAHNHPPACCCRPFDDSKILICPLCPNHGELAQLGNPRPGECPTCHSPIGRDHTDYCQFTGAVNAMPTRRIVNWHRTGEDDAHETWRCSPETCGSHPTQPPIGQTSQPPTRTTTPHGDQAR